MKTVFLDRGSFFLESCFHLLEGITDYQEFQTTSKAQTAERIRDAEAIITNKVILDADVLAHAKNLKYILVLATGTNNIDHDYCRANQIHVDNVEGYSVHSVPEHTFAMLLALKRNLLSYQQSMQNGEWADSEHFCLRNLPLIDLAGSTIAIFGSGSIGQKVASIASAFEMKVHFVERKGAKQCRDGYLPFEEAIEVADILTLHCPLTSDTKNMIAAAEFAKMKPTAMLINTGRGGLVCETSLVDAIKQNKIAAAAFDVATVEPMPIDNPLQALTKHPNFLLTPHVAWASDGAMQKLSDIALQKFGAFLSQV